MSCKVALSNLRRSLFAVGLSLFSLLAWAEAEFLPPEQAFKLSARALDANTAEVKFDVADGYYLYKHRFKFAADQGITPLAAELPAGKRKTDPNFGEVETYRHELVFTLPLQGRASQFNLTVTAQGCADAGLCYPPFKQTALIELSGLAPAGNTSGAAQASSAKATPVAEASSSDNKDESSRISALLSGGNFALTLVSFFGFGLLLAFTPCVFPMLPILSGIIVGQGERITKQRAFTLSAAYVLGMALTYTAAGVAAGLSGTLLSSALQNAWVLGSFAIIFVVLSLSMFGFYDLQLPNSLQSRLTASANQQQGGSLAGVSLMGALSALIVGPCVAAPLAGALLYIAQTKDAWLGGAALFAMALGMGVPLLLVGVAARSVLPRAGGWMEGVKKAFGVMLLGVAIWIVSPVVSPLFSMLAIAALLIFSAIFLHALDPLPHTASGWQRFWKGAGVVSLLIGCTLIIGALAGSRDPLQPLAILRAAQASNQEAAQHPRFNKISSVAELETVLQQAQKPVLLDFYADWCVSCKEMERFTFTDANVAKSMQAFELIQADVTANSAEDKALLQRFQLFGPPAILLLDHQNKGEERKRFIGYQPADKFQEALNNSLASRQ